MVGPDGDHVLTCLDQKYPKWGAALKVPSSNLPPHVLPCEVLGVVVDSGGSWGHIFQNLLLLVLVLPEVKLWNHNDEINPYPVLGHFLQCLMISSR